MEKITAAGFAGQLRDSEKGGRAEIHVIDEGQKVPDDEDQEKLQAVLPFEKQDQVKPAEEDKAKADLAMRKAITLYEVSDAEGAIKISEVKTGPLSQSDLKTVEAYIVDNGSFGIWCWVGKGCSSAERREAVKNAQGFIGKKGYPVHTPITRVNEFGETAAFKSLFKDWRNKDQSKLTLKRAVSKPTVQMKFDAASLHERPDVAADSGMVDDGSGAMEVFRVEHFELESVPEKEFGKFYSGDCYVVLYAYTANGKSNYIIYYWLGNYSSQDERGTAALKTIELDNRLGGAPVEVRVVQGKEPPHFLAIFKGMFRICFGGKSSSFDKSGGKVNGHVGEGGDVKLFQVHGRSAMTAMTVEVEAKAASLNSNDCFVLVSSGRTKETLVWLGKSSTGDEREVAKKVAGSLTTGSVDYNVVIEGREGQSFWTHLGGKAEYISDSGAKAAKATRQEAREPRLFQCSNASGKFQVEEIEGFSQADLIPADVMLLDVGHTLFLWIGDESLDSERSEAATMTQDYLSSDPSGRDTDIPVIKIKQGREPPTFYGYFGAWDPNFWSVAPI